MTREQAKELVEALEGMMAAKIEESKERSDCGEWLALDAAKEVVVEKLAQIGGAS